MIKLTQARKIIDDNVKPLDPVKVPIDEAVGCAVAETITSPINVPGFACSKMDGVAIRYKDLNGRKPWELPLQNVVAAGDNPDQELFSKHAVKIMTGAPVISGADTVVKVEDVRFEGNTVVLSENITEGQFVRETGDDTKIGDRLFKPGDVLTPVDIGVLASVGLTHVMVIPRPKVAILCTGSELVSPGQSLLPGQIYDSNRSILQSLIQKQNLPQKEIVTMVPDKKEKLAGIMENCLKGTDLVITSGGVSMGDYDYLPEVIRLLGGEILFHKVRVKPGKPVLVARIGQTWVVSLPGNPVSVVACYHLYARRIIALLMNQNCEPFRSRAILKNDVTVKGDRLCLVGVKLVFEKNMPAAYPSVRQDSGRISSISGINGFILLDTDIRSLKSGDEVIVEGLY
jgi:molybdopterin molybdotransferase